MMCPATLRGSAVRRRTGPRDGGAAAHVVVGELAVGAIAQDMVVVADVVVTVVATPTPMAAMHANPECVDVIAVGERRAGYAVVAAATRPTRLLAMIRNVL